MNSLLSLTLLGVGASRQADIPVADLIMAGWTGRDRAAVEAHIKELGALGVAAPKRVPTFSGVGASLLTTASAVDVVGHDSTGEVEYVLLNGDNELWVGVGSDHTDRKVEAVGVTISKQMCPKPMAPVAWALAEIESHWDELILRSYAVSDGKRSLYQEASVSAMLHPRDLIELYARHNRAGFLPGTVMFGGTLPVMGGIRWTDCFSIELEDPRLERRITHTYQIRALPLEG
jgi:hypothetical protein